MFSSTKEWVVFIRARFTHRKRPIVKFVKSSIWPGHPSKAPSIIQVDWIAPACGWIKVNTDGAAKGSPGQAGLAEEGAIFRDKISGAVLGCFADFYGVTNTFIVELFVAKSTMWLLIKAITYFG